MVTEITLNSRTTDSNDNTYWGIVEDTMIQEANPTLNYGLTTALSVGRFGGAGNTKIILLHLKMPPQPENADFITSIKLYMYRWATDPLVANASRILGIVPLSEGDPKFIEGNQNAAAPTVGCTWDERMVGRVWAGRGDIESPLSSFLLAVADDAAVWKNWTLAKTGLNWGSEQEVIIKHIPTVVDIYDKFHSTDFTTNEALRPYLEIKYVEKQPEIPDAKDEILTIEANPANPTQPLLKWKTPDNLSLRLDSSGGFVLVKSETIIDAITDGTLIARLNQGEEYIDTGGILATTENNLYYYKLYFCSETDYIAGTGTGLMSGMTIVGSPTASNQVWMIRPDVASFIFTADYLPDVKEQRTATITAVVAGDFASTPSAVQHTHYQFDWKGDSTEVGWVELETPANSYAKTHYYLAYQAATSAKARIQNSLGFWSDATNSDDTVTVAAITAIPIVNVLPKTMTQAEHILRVSGYHSYAQSSNETITKYEFRVVRSSDSNEWDGVTWTGVGLPKWIDMTTQPYMDISSSDMNIVATYTCYVRVQSSSFGASSTSDNTTMTVTSAASVDMKAILTSSNFEMQNIGRKRVKKRHRVIEGTSEIIIDSGIEMPQIRISGHCHGSTFQTDYNQLLTWQNSDTLLKVYTDPQATTPSKYIEGWIEGVTFTKDKSMNVRWECRFVSKTASM